MQLPKTEVKSALKMKTPKKGAATPAKGNKTPEPVKTPKTPKTPKNKNPNTPNKTPAKKITTNTPNKTPGKKITTNTPNKTPGKKMKPNSPTIVQTPGKKNKQSPKPKQNTPNKKQEKKPVAAIKTVAVASPTKKKRSRGKKNKQNSEVKMNGPQIQVYFPNLADNYKTALMNVLKLSDSVANPKTITLKYSNVETAKKQLAALEKITLGKKKLTCKLLSQKDEPLKRLVLLKPIGADTELVKKHFGAVSIEQLNFWGRPIPSHVLTYKTKEAAVKASEKKMDIDGRTVSLKPFFTKEKCTEPAPETGSKRALEPKDKSAKKIKTEVKQELTIDEEDSSDDEDYAEEEEEEEEDGSEEEDSDDDDSDDE